MNPALGPIACLLVFGLAATPTAFAQDTAHAPVSLVLDWTSQNVVYTAPTAPEIRDLVDATLAQPALLQSHVRGEANITTAAQSPEASVLADPRFWQQYLRRYFSPIPAESAHPDAKVADTADPYATLARRAVRRDWSFSLNGGSGGSTASPAKFVFDVTKPASCTTDFVVFGVSVAGAGGQANLVGLNNLYSNPAGTGSCSGNAPKVIFAYNVGPGTVPSNVVLSLDGTKVAFNENNAASSNFHVLTYKTAAGNGTSASAPAVPGTGNTAVDVKLPLGTATTTAPFVDYRADVAYVSDNNGVLHKFTGVFTGTPTEVSGGGSGWPIAAGIAVSTPVFDSVTRRIFVTTSSGIRYFDDSVVPAVLSGSAFNFSAAGNQQTPVIVDSTNQKVYAFGRNSGGTNALIAQADTSLSAGSQVTTPVGKGSANASPRQGDFNNAYYNGTAGSAFLYVTGNDSSGNQLPSLFRIGFNGSFKMNNTTAVGPLKLTSNTAGVSASPITIFFNANTNKEYLFVGVSDACGAPGIPGGCIRSLDITSAFPTDANKNTVVLATTGGTGGITVDNNSVSAEAASVYFGPVTGNTLNKATQSGLQ